MAEPASSGAMGIVIWKFGALKLLGLGAAILGAGMMAIFRPPKTRRELFYQCAVALGSSLLFGGAAVSALDFYFDWIDLKTAPLEEVFQFTGMVHGLIGALSWGVFGGLSVLRDKLGSDPVQAVKDVKDAM